jgi:myosin heavy subunit
MQPATHSVSCGCSALVNSYLCRRLESTERELTYTTQCLNSTRDELHKLKNTFHITLDAQIRACKASWMEHTNHFTQPAPHLAALSPIQDPSTTGVATCETDTMSSNLTHAEAGVVEESPDKNAFIAADGNDNEYIVHLQQKLSAAEAIINDLTGLLKAREDDKEELECEHDRTLQKAADAARSILDARNMELTATTIALTTYKEKLNASMKECEAMSKANEACKKDLESRKLLMQSCENDAKSTHIELKKCQEKLEQCKKDADAEKRELIKKCKTEKKEIRAKLNQVTNENIQLQLQLTREVAFKDTLSVQYTELEKVYQDVLATDCERTKLLEVSQNRVDKLNALLQESHSAEKVVAIADATANNSHAAASSETVGSATALQKEVTKLKKKLNTKQDKHELQLHERDSKHEQQTRDREALHMKQLKEKDAENARLAAILNDQKAELQQKSNEYVLRLAETRRNERMKYFGTPDADALILRLQSQLQKETEQYKVAEHDALVAAQEFTKACQTWQEKERWYESTIAALEVEPSLSADNKLPVTFSTILDGIQIERRSFVTQLTSAFLYMRMIYTHVLQRGGNNLPEDDVTTIESALAQIGRLVTDSNGIAVWHGQKVMSQDPE